MIGLYSKILGFFVGMLDDVAYRREMRRLKLDLFREGIAIGTRLISSFASTHATSREDSPAREQPEITESEYRPDAPERIVLDDGRVAYYAMSDIIVAPGDISLIFADVKRRVRGTGFPGMPETMETAVGVAEPFKIETIGISPGFALTGCFVGASNAFAHVAREIPAEHLASGQRQLDYLSAAEGDRIAIMVKNTSDRSQPAWVRLIGTVREPH